MLQNAAKYGKLVENLGNFGGARFGPRQRFAPKRTPERIFRDCEECCKNTLLAGKRITSAGFPAKGPVCISFYPPGGISCT